MRLFLLPISTRRSLIYCQRLNNQLSDQLTYVDRITNRASRLWVTWEKADKGWQKQVTDYGNKLFERISYEEWGLKSIPPLSARRKDEELKGEKDIELIFAPSLTRQESILQTLHKLATEKQTIHRKWMWGSIIGMPLTAPFALIPIVPNLPFFYLVFRAWSHWRALSGSKHIEYLLKLELIKPTPSWILDATYGVGKLATETPEAGSKVLSSSDISDEPKEANERMLLHSDDANIIAESVQVPEIVIEVQRAVKQVEQSLAATKELEEEMQHLGSKKLKR